MHTKTPFAGQPRNAPYIFTISFGKTPMLGSYSLSIAFQLMPQYFHTHGSVYLGCPASLASCPSVVTLHQIWGAFDIYYAPWFMCHTRKEKCCQEICRMLLNAKCIPISEIQNVKKNMHLESGKSGLHCSKPGCLREMVYLSKYGPRIRASNQAQTLALMLRVVVPPFF